MKRALLLLLALSLAMTPQVDAGPRKRAIKPLKAVATSKPKAKDPVVSSAAAANSSSAKAKATLAATAKRGAKANPKAAAKPKAKGAARVAFSVAGELRPTREVIGRRDEPLTLEEDIAKQIEKILRGPLRRGITGVYVADASSGAPLFSVNADDSLNPASNVKMISTAAALELLGPTFRYSTRVLGREPDAQGAIKGDLFLLGTWDPTLTIGDMEDLAKQIAGKGLKQLDGDILVGSDPTRDGIFRAMVPIEIVAGEPNQPPTVSGPANFDLVEIVNKAKTEKRPRKRHRLKFATETFNNDKGRKRIRLTITGTIGKDGDAKYPLYTRERTAMASHALIAALRAHNVIVNGDMRVVELGDFVGTAVGAAGLPIELARHDSDQLADIVRRINKWSVNWLSDRVIMTAAALARRTQPSMQVAVEAMYDWLARHTNLTKDSIIIDTGSGLSYRTRMTPTELVKILRAAAGFTPGVDPALSKAWNESLSIAGNDGTLRSRFRPYRVKGQLVGGEVKNHLRGKTGSLSTVIALTGVLDLDPSRPLVFSIITNTPSPLRKQFVRKAHEQVVSLLAQYATATAKPSSMPAGTPVKIGTPTATTPTLDDKAVSIPDDVAEPQLDPELDNETANHEPRPELEGEPAAEPEETEGPTSKPAP